MSGAARTSLPPPVGPADVAVFWDYENVRIPEWCPVSKASERIREKVIGFGRIVERRLYYDSSKPSERSLSRAELDLSGFTLVDCPSRNHKETLDKKLIVDVLFFAWERASRGARACVVLITSDGDYSYTLARLQDIGVHTIIMFRPDVVAKILIDNANIVMSWEYDVLGGIPAGTVPPPLEPLTTGSSTTSTVLTKPTTTTSSPNVLWQDLQGMFVIFCTCVLNSQYKRVGVGTGITSVYKCWGLNASIAAEFYHKCGSKDKERFVAVRTKATERGFVEWGRRDLEAPGTPVIQCKENDREGKSIETYLRLTLSGLTLLRPDSTPEAEKSSETYTRCNTT